MSSDVMTGQCRQKRFRDSTQPSATAQDSPGKANHATSFLMICRRSEMGWYPLGGILHVDLEQAFFNKIAKTQQLKNSRT